VYLSSPPPPPPPHLPHPPQIQAQGLSHKAHFYTSVAPVVVDSAVCVKHGNKIYSPKALTLHNYA
jgi:hypothetical protein